MGRPLDTHWDPVVRAHLAHLGTQGRSPTTLRAYRADLDDLGRLLAAELEVPPAALTLPMLDLGVLEAALSAYRQRRDQRHSRSDPGPSRQVRRTASVARRIAALRGLLRYAFDHGMLTEDLARGLHTPKQPRRLPRLLAEDVATRAVAAAAVGARWPARDQLVVALGLACGLRRAEIVGLTIDGLQGVPPERLAVRGKGGKERIVGVPPLVVQLLAAYLPEREAQLATMVGRLGAFARRHGVSGPLALHAEAVVVATRLQPVRHEGVVVAAHANAGIDVVGHVVDRTLRTLAVRRDGDLAHTLRHTFAATALREGVMNLRELQEALGHESLATTQVYTHVTADEVVAAMRAHPLGQAS